MYDVIVIGGGPAGLMAAISASDKGATVLLLEKMEKPARKLRITGKGRCNITNTKNCDDFLRHVFPDAAFFKPAFMNFSNVDLVKFLNDAGVLTVTERGDRVFPASNRAWDVAEALVNRAKHSGVTILCHAKVTRLVAEGKLITGVEYEQEGKRRYLETKAVILATGGLSYPATGSTGDGYAWASALGHTIVAQRPSLVALKISELNQAKSLSLRNINLRLTIDGNTAQEEFGEMELCEDSIAGPCVLRISRKAGEALRRNGKVSVGIDLKPALTRQQLVARIARETEQAPANVGLGYLLGKLMPRELAVSFATKMQLSAGKNIRKITASDINKIIDGLKNYDLRVTALGSYTEAVITAGGVSLADIHSKTMQSKLINNLYFAGELIDLDANTGGYNLQIAFSTGFLAGLNVLP